MLDQAGTPEQDLGTAVEVGEGAEDVDVWTGVLELELLDEDVDVDVDFGGADDEDEDVGADELPPVKELLIAAS